MKQISEMTRKELCEFIEVELMNSANLCEECIAHGHGDCEAHCSIPDYTATPNWALVVEKMLRKDKSIVITINVNATMELDNN